MEELLRIVDENGEGELKDEHMEAFLRHCQTLDETKSELVWRQGRFDRMFRESIDRVAKEVVDHIVERTKTTADRETPYQLVEIGMATGVLLEAILRLWRPLRKENLVPPLHYYGIDFDPVAVRLAQERFGSSDDFQFTSVVANVANFAEALGLTSVNAIASHLVLMLLTQNRLQSLLESVARVLKPGGLFTHVVAAPSNEHSLSNSPEAQPFMKLRLSMAKLVTSDHPHLLSKMSTCLAGGGASLVTIVERHGLTLIRRDDFLAHGPVTIVPREYFHDTMMFLFYFTSLFTRESKKAYLEDVDRVLDEVLEEKRKHENEKNKEGEEGEITFVTPARLISFVKN
eukprot:TRINITY_DN8813_c0_g1_i1.p1 TRINITY_DN8813_c0_g1~~TRINITY_DN8813_c0_g1_i1.p1  ORF type:complete len:344 (+),score=86.10 TRINITY_DN8813_c0_g1_i1:56-1087(+)